MKLLIGKYWKDISEPPHFQNIYFSIACFSPCTCCFSKIFSKNASESVSLTGKVQRPPETSRGKRQKGCGKFRKEGRNRS